MNRIFTIALLILICSSCSYRQSYDREWEGIKGNTMRIFISDFFRDEDEKKIKSSIKELANERAMLILASHATIHLRKSRISRTSDRLINDAITLSLKSSRTLYIECSENNYCKSMNEFNITPFIKTLEKINSK